MNLARGFRGFRGFLGGSSVPARVRAHARGCARTTTGNKPTEPTKPISGLSGGARLVANPLERHDANDGSHRQVLDRQRVGLADAVRTDRSNSDISKAMSHPPQAYP